MPLSSLGKAGSLQAKQSSTSRTMAADFTSCRAEPSSLLICFLQFLPQTVTPAKWIHATLLIMRPVWSHFKDLTRLATGRKRKTKRHTMAMIMMTSYTIQEMTKSSLHFCTVATAVCTRQSNLQRTIETLRSPRRAITTPAPPHPPKMKKGRPPRLSADGGEKAPVDTRLSSARPC